MSLIKLEVATPTVKVHQLGEFTVNSGAIRFSDPCYGNDTWCKGSMPAANGKYQAQIGFFRDSYDERCLLEHIDQLKFFKDYTVKYSESDYDTDFRSLVRDARDHGKWGGHFQKIDKLFELINAIEDVDKRAHLLNMAEWSVAWFNPRYKGEKHHYWEKDLWLLFEISGAFSNISEISFYSRRAWYTLNEIQQVQDDESLSKEDRDAKLAELNKKLDKERLNFQDVIDSKIDEVQKSFDEGKPFRTHFLHIKHESVPEFTSFDAEAWFENDKFDVGVDSGQAGFFDEGWFTGYGKEREKDERSKEWEKTYDMLCDLSSDGSSYRNSHNPTKLEGGVFEFGTNSYTAHGDGSAPLYYRTNDAGEVIEAVYHYDIAYEEDEE